jgi:hypothetical protein
MMTDERLTEIREIASSPATDAGMGHVQEALNEAITEIDRLKDEIAAHVVILRAAHENH